MESLRTYLISVTAAALICALLIRLLPKGGTAGTMGKLLAGIFLAFTVIGPWTKVRIDGLLDWTDELQIQASQAVAQGQLQSNMALQNSIKAQTQAYILDKAKELGLTLKVEVTVSQDPLPTPVWVTLTGNVGPYAKTRLQAIVTNDLGIPKERQIWK